jgi:hypothetical protein
MLCLRQIIVCAVLLTVLSWECAEGSTSDEIVAKIRKTATEEILYEFGTLHIATIVPDQNAVRLKCSENPDDVAEILIGADSQNITYIAFYPPAVSGGSPLRE